MNENALHVTHAQMNVLVSKIANYYPGQFHIGAVPVKDGFAINFIDHTQIDLCFESLGKSGFQGTMQLIDSVAHVYAAATA